MKKKSILLLFVLLLITALAFFYSRSISHLAVLPHTKIPTSTREQVAPPQNIASLFVPYWSMNANAYSGKQYDRFIYFGLAVDTKGVTQDELGYQKIPQFLSLIPASQKKYIVVRMLDTDTNFAILKNKQRQNQIITQTLAIVEKYHFDGVFLDLELSSFPFSSIVTQITDYVALFHDQLKNKKLHFGVLVYGDTFYRIRPYDIISLAKNSDEIMVMAYDFSKASGNPGPNFPFYGQNTYGYDFQTMVNDFINFVPKEKLSFVFGLFGYDWVVDSQQKTIKQGVSESYAEIKQKFLPICHYTDCVIQKDSSQSAETNILYQDVQEQQHSVWFEDMESIAVKKEYLEKKGIHSIGFWAYSYF